MPPRIRLDFYYDIGSPYTYFAFEILSRYESIWNLDLRLHPTLLGGVFKLTGNSSPAATEHKRIHMLKDLDRVSKEYKIPLSTGPEFPGNTLQVMRLLRYLKDEVSPQQLKDITRHYFKQNFVVNTPLSDPSFLTSLTTSQPLLLPRDQIESALQNYSGKDKQRITELMKKDCAKLVEDHHAFGFPWMVIHRADGKAESFFGSDRFSNISWWLGQDDYPWYGPAPHLTAHL